VGYVTARAEAQVLRLSILYALLDGSAVIKEQHLLAALALWEYAEASARFIFGDSLGDPTADQILRALHESGSGLSRTEISGLFGRHRPAAEIERALRSLSELGLVRRNALRQTEGRPTEVWICVARDEAKKANYAK
jgi:DNA-binding transcriptional ArsR family regulator